MTRFLAFVLALAMAGGHPAAGQVTVVDIPLLPHYQAVGRLASDLQTCRFTLGDATASLTIVQITTTTPALTWTVHRADGKKFGRVELEAEGGFCGTFEPDDPNQVVPLPFQPAPNTVNHLIGIPFSNVTFIDVHSPERPDHEIPLVLNVDFYGSSYGISIFPNDSVIVKDLMEGVVTVPVFCGDTAVRTAEVSLIAVAPSGTVQQSVCRDDGVPPDEARDGLFTGTYNADEVGQWTLGAHAKITTESGTIVPRSCAANVDVIEGWAALVRPQAPTVTCEYQPVTNYLTGIRVTTAVNSTRDGPGFLEVRLRLPTGQVLSKREHLQLLNGLQAVSVFFTAGEVITEQTGSAVVEAIGLWIEDPVTAIVDELPTLNLSSCSFSPIDTAGPDIEFLESCTSRKVDTNGNGRADLLIIDVPLRVRRGGFMGYSASLCNDCGARIGEVHGEIAVLRSPRFILSLVFDGRRIGHSGVDGPYHICELTLWRRDGTAAYMAHSYDCHTPAYSVFEFEEAIHCADRNQNSVCDLCEIHTRGFSLDQNGDGIPDDTPNYRPCLRVADIVGAGGPPVGPDGCVTEDDFNAFMDAYSRGALLADVSGPNGRPDGLVTEEDLAAFLLAYTDCFNNCTPTGE